MLLNGNSLYLGLTLSAHNVNLGSSELVYGMLNPLSVSHYLHALFSKVKENTLPTLFSYGIVSCEYDVRKSGSKHVPNFIRQTESPFSPGAKRIDHPYYDELRANLTVKVAFEVKDMEIYQALISDQSLLLDVRFVGAEVGEVSIKELCDKTYHTFFYGSRVLVDKTKMLSTVCTENGIDINEAFFEIVGNFKQKGDDGHYIKADKREELKELSSGWTVPIVVGYRKLERDPVATRIGVRNDLEHIFVEYAYGLGEFRSIKDNGDNLKSSHLFSVKLNDSEVFYTVEGN